MMLTIFAQKRQRRDGVSFANYLSTLTRKDGTEMRVRVKFRKNTQMPKPDDCPCNIVVRKEDANLSPYEYTDQETGEVRTAYQLWVKEWTPGPAYEDHSLDDFED